MNDKTLVERLRDEDSYYRIQEKHWCVDAEELKRQRLAAADRIEALEAENADLNRRLGNICMSIHTCTGDECERPICIANRKNKALEAALRECIDVMGPLAKHPNVNPWLIQAKQALESKP